MWMGSAGLAAGAELAPRCGIVLVRSWRSPLVLGRGEKSAKRRPITEVTCSAACHVFPVDIIFWPPPGTGSSDFSAGARAHGAQLPRPPLGHCQHLGAGGGRRSETPLGALLEWTGPENSPQKLFLPLKRQFSCPGMFPQGSALKQGVQHRPRTKEQKGFGSPVMKLG